ncbi:MAG: tetratricopeptide repeat protein, partial [Candidatus Competibacter sp.]|nr:tetratricopeptide repeat protein [Candidatus Competibacter sp.]
MNRLQKCWTWLEKSRNQKTLAFMGSGLAIVAGAAWQLYPHWLGADQSKSSGAGTITVNAPVSFSGPVHDSTINQPGGTINNYGIPPEEFRRLAGELSVTQSALESFFKILEKAQVPQRDLDSTLREIAKRYKDLQAKLDGFGSDDPEIETLKRQAEEVLDAGDFERAEKLLNQASERDIRAANELQAIAKKRLLSAAAAKAANGGLKYTQLAYAEAAAYYRQAAELVPAGEESTLATYLLFQGMNLGTAGQYPAAVQALERSLSLREKALGPDHPDNALNLILLATLYSAQDKLIEIEPLYLRALAIQEKALGPDHPDVALSLNGLGFLYRARGQYAKAEPPLQRALAILEKSAGMNPEAMFPILLNLAQLYRTQGRYAEAEPPLQRALDTAGQVFGPDHPLVAAASGFLGGLYSSQGRHTEAEALQQRALAINEKVFGPNSPNTAESLANLAFAYQARGDHAKAEPLLKRALPLLEQTF